MKYIPLILLFMLLQEVVYSQGKNNVDQSVPVRTEISLSAKKYTANTTGWIVVKFLPEKHYHVNTIPAPEIRLDSGSAVTLLDSVEIPKGKKDTTQIDTRKMFRSQFKISEGIKNGKHDIKGKYVFTYCSEKEDECFKTSVPFELPITIMKK